MINGSINLNRLTPQAFIAVSSLRLAALPAVNIAANNTATGVISFIISGAKTI